VAMVVQVRHQVKSHHKHLHTCMQLGMHASIYHQYWALV
jgi:hypothetical protein